MSYRVLTTVSNTPEWLRGRKGLIGASEVACILGLSKWSTPLGIYLDKLNPNVEDTMTERQKFGHKLEPIIADEFEEQTGIEVFPSPGLLQSTEYPWLGATPDRVTKLGEPVELKSSDAFMKSDWEAGPPDNYRIQVLVQMIVLGVRRGWLAVLHGGNEFDWYEIEWDQAAVDMIIRITEDFWTNNVEALVPPEPVTSADAALAFPNPADVSIEGGEALHEAWGAYGLMQAELKELETTLDGMKLEFQKAMAEDATALTYNGVPLFTWKTRKGSTRFDATAFKGEHPDIHAEYMVTGKDTRTFLRKTIKEVTR